MVFSFNVLCKQTFSCSKAKSIYDGPLRHKVFIICGEHEFGKISLAAARKSKIEAYRLPLDRYVKYVLKLL